MRAKIWGCRGSLAAPGADTVRYGGNTSCVQVTLDDGSLVVLDAGTGIRQLGLEPFAAEARKVHLLVTHLHLDHIEGLGFFFPLWVEGVEFHLWGPASPTLSLEQRIERLLSPPLFPVHLKDVPCDLIFHDAPDGEFQIGSATVASQPVSHAGPAVGYRLSEGDSSLAYIPDHEPTHGGSLEGLDPSWISGFDLADGADVLLHDSQYTEAEYPAKVGWGHSSVRHVTEFARATGVGQLVMFHHDPLHTDDALEVHLRRARELWGERPNPPVLAHEGMEFELPGRGLVPAGGAADTRG